MALIDVTAGLHTALGIVAALYHRKENGRGQKIEINLLSSALSGMVNQTGAYAGASVTPLAMGNAHPSIAPYEVYKAKDVQIVIAVGNDAQFTKLCLVLGIGLDSDEKFGSNVQRVLHRAELNALIAPILAAKGGAHWVAECTKVGVPAGPINDVEAAVVLADQLGLMPIVTITDPRDQSISRTIVNPINFSKTPVEYYLGPPALGIDD